MDDLPDFTREEKLREIAFEIVLRRAVYRRKIARREMRPEEAERRINIMRAIALDYGGHGGDSN